METNTTQKIKIDGEELITRPLPKLVFSPAIRAVFPSQMTHVEINAHLRSHQELGCLPMWSTDSKGVKLSVATTTNYSHTVFMRPNEYEIYAAKFNFRQLSEETVAEPNVVFNH